MRRARLAALVLVIAAAGCSQPASTPQQTPAAPPPQAVPSLPASAADLPPLPRVPFEPARPMPVVEAVFRFAAEHPEVLSHIPCFCGCENRGHKHNDDCFVAARDDRGRVTAWEPHGIG